MRRLTSGELTWQGMGLHVVLYFSKLLIAEIIRFSDTECPLKKSHLKTAKCNIVYLSLPDSFKAPTKTTKISLYRYLVALYNQHWLRYTN